MSQNNSAHKGAIRQLGLRLSKVVLEDWYRATWIVEYQTKVAAGEVVEEYDTEKMIAFVDKRLRPCHHKNRKRAPGMKKVNRKTHIAAQINKLPCLVHVFPKGIPEQPCCAMRCRNRSSKCFCIYVNVFLTGM